MNLTLAEAWCWVARLHSKEEDALVYKHPRTDDDLAAADEHRAVADVFYAEASKLDSDPELWRRALDKWDQKGSDT